MFQSGLSNIDILGAQSCSLEDMPIFSHYMIYDSQVMYVLLSFDSLVI
jgi:hypothetical protein